MNAQKKSLDVWLKYRCPDCDAVWKAPILERFPTARLDGALREAFERDDPATVARYAFDTQRFRAHVIDVVSDATLHIERLPAVHDCQAAVQRCVHLETPLPCDVRLDRLLAAELGLSRTQLQRALADGRLTVNPAVEGALRRNVRSGQCVRLCEGLGNAG